MLSAASEGWIPPKEFTEEQYQEIKKSTCSPLKGYAAFALSYGGKKWGGWCRDKDGKRNYVDEAYRNALMQFPKLLGVKFLLSDFRNLQITNGSVVYCDPPYESTTGYKEKFHHDEFWQWVRDLSKMNDVFVSEYNAPDDFEIVWQKETTSSLTKDTGAKRATEKLFRRKK